MKKEERELTQTIEGIEPGSDLNKNPHDSPVAEIQNMERKTGNVVNRTLNKESNPHHSILKHYYQPLSTCTSGDRLEIPLREPLWQLRQLKCEETGLFLELAKIVLLPVGYDDVLFLLHQTFHCNESLSKEVIDIDKLQADEKQKLLDIARGKSALAPYATSILITLFLRSANRQYRKHALALLTSGQVILEKKHISQLLQKEADLERITLELSNHDDLVHEIYIDFSYGNFSGAGTITLNLSGQYLKKIRAENVSFGKNEWRYACLQEASFKQAGFAEKHDFTGTNFWKTNFTGAIINGCRFDKVNAHGALFIRVKARKTQWRMANLMMPFCVGKRKKYPISARRIFCRHSLPGQLLSG